MTKFKKSLLALSSLGVLATPLIAVVSCSVSSRKSYDFGLATAPINSLNYIKYKNTATVAPALVEGLFKSGSSDKTIQTQLNFPTYNWKVATGTDSRSSTSSSYWPISNWGYLPGSTISSSSGNPVASLALDPALSTFSQIAFQLNDKHQWSTWNNSNPAYGKVGERRDYVTGQNYIDSLKYILDINTGSQLVVDLLEYGINNAQKIWDLQMEYYEKFDETYLDPWGWKAQWQPQLKDSSPKLKDKTQAERDAIHQSEQALVAKIKAAALAFGVFTADQYTSLKPIYEMEADGVTPKKDANNAPIESVHGNKDIAWFSSAKLNSVDDKHQLFFQFDQNKPLSRSKITDFARRTFFLPVNRDFVEATGGIQKFGIDKSHILWNSAFTPEKINLGPAGYIDLVKDSNYYAADRTVSNRIKIFFQSDPTVLSSMFEDGYISDVRIPAVQQLNFWSNPDIRRYMFKSNGFGTLAFEFNLDKQTGNPALQDENLRKAISYSIDRNALSLVAGQESSFPVTTWTAFGQAKDSIGTPIETFFDKESFSPVTSAERDSIKASNGLTDDQLNKLVPEKMPIQSYPYTVHNAKIMQFERVDRDDIGYNETLARFFLDKYKAAHPGAQQIKLTYIYDGQTLNKNIGIYLQSQLRKVLGGFVDIDVQGLPANVFETYKTTGEYDILFYNFDSYGTEWDSYVKRFFEPDQIETRVTFTTLNDKSLTEEEILKLTEAQVKAEASARKISSSGTQAEIAKVLITKFGVRTKSEGFKDNPAGSWTYKSFFDSLSQSDDAALRAQLDIEQSVWDKIKALANGTNDIRNAFFAKKDADATFQDDKKIIAVVAGLEKIIRHTMPVLPLMEVDTYWEAKRVFGVDSLYSFSLQTAYDVENRPNPALPGLKS